MKRSIIHAFTLLPGIIVTIVSLASHAEIIELKLQPDNLIVSAEYKAGKAALPAVILIHGFLQTRESPTVHRLADELSNLGYPTLAPTLSLGVSNRAQSLGCEAIHVHTMESDAKETEKWIAWLSSKGYKNIVLIGHSRANNQILYYLSGNPAASIKKAILLSLVDDDYHTLKTKKREQIALAQLRFKSGDNTLHPYKTDFCTKFMATPQSYLSYHEFSRSKVIKTLHNSKKPVEIIIGREDDRMTQDWPNYLSAAGNKVTVINDGNHFFDNLAEFGLLDNVSRSLSSVKLER